MRNISKRIVKIKRDVISNISKAHLIVSLQFIILFSLFTTLTTTANDHIDSTLSKATIENQEIELKIKYLLKEANEYFFKNDYKKAIKNYLKAISLLTTNFPKSQENIKKSEEIKRSISLVYSTWAEEILVRAEDASQEGDIKKALELADKAAEINPKLKEKSNQLKEKLNRKIMEDKFHELTTDDKHKKQNNQKSYNISVLFEQGKILFKQDELNRAKDKFEEILVVDPYNSKAIHYLNLINQKLYKDAENRKNQASAQRTTEVTWASVLPITSENLTGERIDFSGAAKKISRRGEKTSLEERLNEIIIPHISFDSVPAEDALLFLKEESKRLDPSEKGINLILKLGENPDQYTVSLTANNMPLKEVIKEVCDDAGLNLLVKRHAVLISSGEPSASELITKVFASEREDFGSLLIDAVVTPSTAVDMKEYFVTRDVNFPEGASAVYDLRISRLIVRNTPEELLKIKKILEKLDKAVNPQVSIASKFIEIKQSDFEEIGFEWEIGRSNSNVSFPQLNEATRDTVDIGQSEVVNDRMIKIGIDQNDWDISTTLHALSQSGKTETLSSPRVTTLNGYTTVIRIVTERYFPEEWSEPKIIETTANDATTSWLVSSIPTFGSATELGIVLKVTPFVNSDNYTIDLILEPLIQAFAGYNEDYTYTANLPYNDNGNEKLYAVTYTQPMPIITNRTIKTRLQVYDGDTVILGGALQDKTTKYNDRVPIMGDLPLVGRMFQSEIEDVEKTNLLIFTTVVLIMPDGTPLRPIKSTGRANFPDKF